MIEVAGNFGNRTMSILIDSGASNSYVAHSVVSIVLLRKVTLREKALYN